MGTRRPRPGDRGGDPQRVAQRQRTSRQITLTGIRSQWLPYLLVAPAVGLELLVHVVPVLLGVGLSFLRLDQFTLSDWTNAPYAGLANYRTGLDPRGPVGAELGHTLLRTALFTVLVVALSWGLGMFAALALAVPFRGRAFFRVFFLIPFALPAYVSGMSWRFLFNHDDGAVNRLLVDDLHLRSARPFWLTGDNAFWSTVIVTVWRMWPFAYLILLAAVESVPSERLEAAALDGASAWQRWRSVTLPSIRPTNTLVVLVMTLWSFNEFTVPYVLFDGSPPPSATLVANLVYRDAFATFDVGIAAAVNVLIVVLLLVVALPVLRRARLERAVDA